MKYQPVLDIISERLEQLKLERREFEQFGVPDEDSWAMNEACYIELSWLWDKINKL